MKGNIITALFLLLFIIGANAQQTIKIGDLEWSTTNLSVKYFRNGDPIPQAKSAEEWRRANDNKQPAWCYYDNNENNGHQYGILYNWYAVNDSRGLAPKGFRVPSKDDFGNFVFGLRSHRMMGYLYDGVLKTKGAWPENGGLNSANASNKAGFSALPGGHRGSKPMDLEMFGGRFFSPEFNELGSGTHFWFSTEKSDKEAYGLGMFSEKADLYKSLYACPKGDGMYVRVVKDAKSDNKTDNSDGTSTISYQGKKIMKGKLVQRVPIGTWILYDRDEQPHMEYIFQNGKVIRKKVLNNWMETYKWDNGNIQGQGPAAYNLPGFNVNNEGVYEYSEAQLYYPTKFMRTGKWKHYYESGAIKSEGVYNEYNNKNIGVWTYYHETGEKKKTITYSTKGVAEGPAVYFYKSGNIFQKGSFINNKQEGMWLTYYKDGKLKYETEWLTEESGVRVQYFYKNGEVSSKTNGMVDYDAKKTGNWKSYHFNGKLREVASFDKGKRTAMVEAYDLDGTPILTNGNGTYKVYHDNGQLSHKAVFTNGQRSGDVYWYYDNGQLSQKAIYKLNPSTVGKDYLGYRWEVVSSFTRDGEPRDGGTLKNGNGTWISYDKNGDVSKISTFKDGVNIKK